MKNFNDIHKENINQNQYWYSANTVNAIVAELGRRGSKRIACLSTPSVFHACREKGFQCDLFDFDESLGVSISPGEINNRFFKFDYRSPSMLQLKERDYDAIVCDPPFISEDALLQYCATIDQLIMPGGAILFSSTPENLATLRNHLGPQMNPVKYKPCIPSLVYQYELFVNYNLPTDSPLSKFNPEVSLDHSPGWQSTARN
jgi:hypothetical protein